MYLFGNNRIFKGSELQIEGATTETVGRMQMQV